MAGSHILESLSSAPPQPQGTHCSRKLGWRWGSQNSDQCLCGRLRFHCATVTAPIIYFWTSTCPEGTVHLQGRCGVFLVCSVVMCTRWLGNLSVSILLRMDQLSLKQRSWAGRDAGISGVPSPYFMKNKQALGHRHLSQDPMTDEGQKRAAMPAYS